MGYGYGLHWGMMSWGNGGFWPFGMIIWLVIIVGILALVVWGVGAFSSRIREGERPASAVDTLERRYARGEIGRDEYLQKKADIFGH